MKKKLRICIDLDGTICDIRHDPLTYADVKPKAHAAEKISELRKLGHYIIINTARNMGSTGHNIGKVMKNVGKTTLEWLDKNGIECNCGKKGCFETYCSIKRLKNKLINEMNLSKEVSSKELLEILKWRAKEENIKKILEEYIDNLNIGLSNIIDIFAPQAICLGGGFVYFEEILYKPFLEKYYNERKSFYKDRIPDIKLALLGNDAGIIGATI